MKYKKVTAALMLGFAIFLTGTALFNHGSSLLGAQIFKTQTSEEVESKSSRWNVFSIKAAEKALEKQQAERASQSGELASRDSRERATKRAPESPDFMNDYNAYQGRSELDLILAHSDDIMMEDEGVISTYLQRILSYVDRIKQNPGGYDHLPMWPEYNVVTYGNLTSYLFAGKGDALQYAKNRGLVPETVKQGTFMSPDQIVRLIGAVFLEGESNPAKVLGDRGIVNYAADWTKMDQSGVPLVHAIKIIMELIGEVEAKDIARSAEKYAKKMVALPAGTAKVNEGVMDLLLEAFNAERSAKRARRISKQARDRIVQSYDRYKGRDISSSFVRELRLSFYKEHKLRTPAIYELPERQLLGECGNKLPHKTYMGRVARTGATGATIVCDDLIIQFPANAYLINMSSLPATTMEMEGDIATIRFQSLHSLRNTLIVGEEGEMTMKIYYVPKNLQELPQDATFGFGVYRADGTDLFSGEETYSDIGGLMEIQPRVFDGNETLLFDVNSKN